MRRLKNGLIVASFAVSSCATSFASTPCNARAPASVCGPCACAARSMVSASHARGASMANASNATANAPARLGKALARRKSNCLASAASGTPCAVAGWAETSRVTSQRLRPTRCSRLRRGVLERVSREPPRMHSCAVAATIRAYGKRCAGRAHPRCCKSVNAGAQVGRNLDSLQEQTRNVTAEVVMNWNLYNGGADQARVRQQTHFLSQATDLRDKACRDCARPPRSPTTTHASSSTSSSISTATRSRSRRRATLTASSSTSASAACSTC